MKVIDLASRARVRKPYFNGATEWVTLWPDDNIKTKSIHGCETRLPLLDRPRTPNPHEIARRPYLVELSDSPEYLNPPVRFFHASVTNAVVP